MTLKLRHCTPEDLNEIEIVWQQETDFPAFEVQWCGVVIATLPDLHDAKEYVINTLPFRVASIDRQLDLDINGNPYWVIQKADNDGFHG